MLVVVIVVGMLLHMLAPHTARTRSNEKGEDGGVLSECIIICQ